MHLWFTYEDGSEGFVAGSDLDLYRLNALKKKVEQRTGKKIVGYSVKWHSKIRLKPP